MTCPYMNHDIIMKQNQSKCVNEDDEVKTYDSLLKLPELLGCIKPVTSHHDEHLFLLIHQVYELWFNQIIHEIDSIRQIFSKPPVDENNMLKISSRLSRICKIYALLVEQIKIVETITPLDFAAFRGGLGSASGFQSWQFRILENKLGVRNMRRVRYNNQNYVDIFDDGLREMVIRSESEPSLFELINSWLERTPGLHTSNFDFWNEFSDVCRDMNKQNRNEADSEMDSAERERMHESCEKMENAFNEVLYKEKYDALVARGDRTLSWEAFKGALMIFYNRDATLFHVPFQVLTLLMDLDTLVTKWRSAHVLLVQRQIGSKIGTGGSSGYLYLRSTVSDRYRPFIDLFQLSNYLVPPKYFSKIQVKQVEAENQRKREL